MTIQYEAEDQYDFTVASKFILCAQLSHGVALADPTQRQRESQGGDCRSLYPDELRIG
jgi:hypothetical protein